MPKLATPISHQLSDATLAQDVLALSDCLECRDKSIDSELDRQYLFHCDIQPIHELKYEEIVYLEKIFDKKSELKLLTFHVASNCDCPIIKNMMFFSGGRTYTRDEMLRNAERNIKTIRGIFGNIKIAVENNNYYPTDAYSTVTDPDFLYELVCDNKISFLFDMAHAKVSSVNRKEDYSEYVGKLPMTMAIQMHIVKHSVDTASGIAYDTHMLPDDTVFSEVADLISRYSGIEYLTLEYYKEREGIIRSLEQLRKITGEAR